MARDIYQTRVKMNRPNQNPDILELAEIVDDIRNRLVEIHNCIDAFENQFSIRMGTTGIDFYKNGSVHLYGDDIDIEAQDTIDVKASGNLRIKGSKISHN